MSEFQQNLLGALKDYESVFQLYVMENKKPEQLERELPPFVYESIMRNRERIKALIEKVAKEDLSA